MHVVSLDGKSIEEYLRKIKGYIDELTGVTRSMLMHSSKGYRQITRQLSLLSRVRSVLPLLQKLKLFLMAMRLVLHATIEMLKRPILRR